MIIEARVCGIPCLVDVIGYRYSPGDWRVTDSADDYYGYERFDYEVLDSRGKPAPWLERKMTKDDDEALRAHISDYAEQQRRLCVDR